MAKKPTSKKTTTNPNQEKFIIAGVILIPVILALFLMFNQSRNQPQAITPTLVPTAVAAATQPAETTEQATPTDSPFQIPAEVAARNGKYNAPPPLTIDPQKYYYAVFKTIHGDFKAQLFDEQTPNTVNSFVFLAREGFYDNTTFHLAVDNMVQGGDPIGTGGGGPGYVISEEYAPGLVFDRPGLLGMANAGPGKTGSQFFVTLQPAPQLNGQRTLFGEIVEGMDVVQQITPRNPNGFADVLGDSLISVTIEESDSSVLPTPTPAPPTSTPFSPSQLDTSIRPLATMTATARSNYFNSPPSEIVIESRIYTATMLTTQGTLTLTLRGDLAPVAVNNFVVLADLGFFDNTPINRVNLGDNVILGSPANDPNSDAGYGLKPETNLPVQRAGGMIAYVPKTNDPSSFSGSQFFILYDRPSAEDLVRYSFFGTVEGGRDLLWNLTISDTVQSITVEK